MLVGDLGEEGILERIREIFAPATSDAVRVGIGDDAAVIEPPPAACEEVWTTDLMFEGIHFRTDWQEACDLGYKSLAINLSDLAAMGATPRTALLSLACPRETEVDLILEICTGFRDLALAEGVAVVGGDTSASPGGIVISVTAGGIVSSGGSMLRAGAREGDRVLVTGYPGCARGGLRLREENLDGPYPEMRRAFSRPSVRVETGKAAAAFGATAMIDLSDGLAGDFRHVCVQSSVGGDIDLTNIALHPELLEASREFGWNLEEMVLKGGEDYELLFTMPPDRANDARREISEETGSPVFVIGEILPVRAGISITGLDGVKKELPRYGFDHFHTGG